MRTINVYRICHEVGRYAKSRSFFVVEPSVKVNEQYYKDILLS